MKSENAFTERIDKEGADLLRMLLGLPLYEVRSYQVVINPKTIKSPSFLFWSNNQWTIVTSLWLETPKDLSYYKLEVKSVVSDFLFNWAKSASDNSGPGCEINLGRASGSEVESILIYETDETWGDEQVMYDSALLFKMVNGKRFLLSVIDTIAEFIEFTTDDNLIDDYTNEEIVKLRLTIS